MSPKNSRFELAKGIERYLATLAKLYGHEGERLLQQIVVNAPIRVHEEWSYDNWNGGTYGHALFLKLPEDLFLAVASKKDEIEERIAKRLNNLHNVQDEYIDKVFLELEVLENGDWRQESGALLSAGRVVSDEAIKRIWTDGQFRLFISHKSEVKRETAELKKRLAQFGVSGFVAHTDIQPTQKWQDEIENALASMDGFVALMTEKFHESNWTDQEVGYAFARGVPIVIVRLGRDPYGFIGKFQALSCSWDSAATDITGLFIKNDRMFDSYVNSLRECNSFDRGNTLAKILSKINLPSDTQIDAIVDAYNSNSELRGSFSFNGAKPSYYGRGLMSYLRSWTVRPYLVDSEGKLSVAGATRASEQA
jgi:hypothetical protein